jgi:pimeloyl-ACP methyl ester carboxylesterase
MHPRLLHSLVLIEPIIQRERTKLDDHKYFDIGQMFNKFTRLNLFRRDKWPSRESAAASFQRNPFYQKWDPRVFEKWIKYGLRDIPTAVYPSEEKPSDKTDRGTVPVTLTTTRHQEAFMSNRPVWDHSGLLGGEYTHPDLDPSIPKIYQFYRPEIARAFAQLPFLRPSVLYIYGTEFEVTLPALRADKMRATGTAVGGSGGAAKGRVKEIMLDQIGHMIPQEVPRHCAESVAPWLRSELGRWHLEEKAFAASLTRISATEQATAGDQWKKHLASPGSHRQGNGTMKL